MTIDRTTILFFDASCLIAAAGSPSGGSGFLLSLCTRGLLRATVSQPVLLEAERNISEKMSGEALTRYHRLVVLTRLTLISLPPRSKRRPYLNIAGEKDEHVLTAAMAAEAHFLLTLDKPLAERVNQASLPVQAISPGEFIKIVLPHHIDYPETGR